MSPPSSGNRRDAFQRDTSPDADATAHAQERVCSGNGVKTVEHIARLLTKSPQEVQHILRDLQEMHLVTL